DALPIYVLPDAHPRAPRDAEADRRLPAGPGMELPQPGGGDRVLRDRDRDAHLLRHHLPAAPEAAHRAGRPLGGQYAGVGDDVAAARAQLRPVAADPIRPA